jgi:hypothetical protein
MKIGDEVAWTSQAQGYAKKKRGVIVAIVPPGKTPADVALPEGCAVRGPGLLGRPEESYAVRVGTSKALFWPRVGHLKLAKPTPETLVGDIKEPDSCSSKKSVN